MDLDTVFSEMESRSAPNDSAKFIIDDILRVISVSDDDVILGVEKDKNVNKVDFEMDRYYRENDMSEFSAKVIYENANGERNFTSVTDLSASEDKITFSWLIPAFALKYKGSVRFAVNFVKLSGSIIEKAFNTTIASADCLEGLYVDTQIPEEEFEDYLTTLKNDISDCANSAIDDLNKTKDKISEELNKFESKIPDITPEDSGKSLLVNEDGTGLVVGDVPIDSYTKFESNERYSPYESAMHPTVNGNPVVCNDSIVSVFYGLNIYGKSLQNGVPSSENPVPIIDSMNSGSITIEVSDLSEHSSSFKLTSVDSLHGILTENGSNYTDSNNRKWLCDVVDFKNGIIKKNIVKLTFDGSEDESWSLQSINQSGIANFRILLSGQIYEPDNALRFMSNRFVGQTSLISSTTTEGICISDKNTLYIRINKEKASTVSDFREWLKSNNVELLIPRAEPSVESIFKDDLESYKSVYFYSGVTQVSSSDSISGMEVTYPINGNKYLETKLSKCFEQFYVHWEIGTIDGSGNNSASNTRMRSPKVKYDNDFNYMLMLPDGYLFCYNYYDNTYGHRLNSEYCSIGNVITDSNEFIRFSIKKDDDGEILEDDIDFIASDCKLYKFRKKSEYVVGNQDCSFNSDFVCDGNNDQQFLNVMCRMEENVKILLLPGTYHFSKMYKHEKSGQYYALGIGSNTYKAQTICLEGMIPHRTNTLGCVALSLDISENDLGDKENAMILVPRLEEKLDSLVLTNTSVCLKNFNILGCGYKNSIVYADLTHAASSSIENIEVRGDGSTEGLTVFDTMPNEKCVGIRAGYGSNNGIRQFIKGCMVYKCGKGYSVCGEHFIIEDCLAHHCKIGFCFGDRLVRTNYEHPNIMIGCSIEGCYRLMLLSRYGQTEETVEDKARNTLICIGLSTETSWDNPKDDENYGVYAMTKPIKEITKGAYRGRIELDYSANPFEDGSGSRMSWIRYDGIGQVSSEK